MNPYTANLLLDLEAAIQTYHTGTTQATNGQTVATVADLTNINNSITPTGITMTVDGNGKNWYTLNGTSSLIDLGAGGPVGMSGTGTIGGNGSAGLANNITGSSVTYGGGGGGGTYGGGTAGSGGAGGGGNAGATGTVNTGGGGGGATSNGSNAAAGGSGVAYLKYGSTLVSFTSSGTWTNNTGSTQTVTYLLVAGGGAGGQGTGGGGGGGGVLVSTLAVPNNATLTITIGAGGTTATYNGGNGGNTTLSATFYGTITAVGGGGGGANLGGTATGASGGSGGGGAGAQNNAGGAGTGGQGCAGGAGTANGPNYGAGGGGGASGAAPSLNVVNGGSFTCSFTFNSSDQSGSGTGYTYPTFLAKASPSGSPPAVGSNIWIVLDSDKVNAAFGAMELQRYQGGPLAGKILPNTAHVATYIRTLTGTTYTEAWRVDGVLVASTAGLTIPIWDGISHWTIGATYSGGTPAYFYDGLIGSMQLYSGALTPAQCLQVETYLAGTANVTLATPNQAVNVVFAGNSITDYSGGQLQYAQGYPNQTMAALGRNWQWLNVSLSQAYAEQLTTLAPNDTDPCIIPSAINILIYWELTNSIAEASDTAQQAYAANKAYLVARRAAGFNFIIFLTCLPRTSIEATRQTANILCRADFGTPTANALIFAPNPGVTYADLMIDIGNDPTIGQSGQNTNLAYYESDAIHTKAAGDAIIATYAAEAVKQLVAIAGIALLVGGAAV